VLWWLDDFAQCGHSGALTSDEAKRVKAAHVAEGRHAVVVEKRRR
jgi:hypothetical protein